jgi:hypothetical protein
VRESLFDSIPVQSRETDERWTPAWVFAALEDTFDLDPASPIGGGDYVPAAVKYSRLDDGLARPWAGYVWLNPPFSESTPWADRFREHRCGVWLGPIANARWFVDLARAADRLYLCRDIAFVHPTHAGRRSSMPLAFVALGARATTAVDRLAGSGRITGALVVNYQSATAAASAPSATLA